MRLLSTIATAIALFTSPYAHADITPDVEHDGRYIYYRTALSHMSEKEQVEIIDASVVLLKNEIQTVSSKVTGLKTLSNTLLSGAALDKLTAMAQQSISILDNHQMAELIPAGLFIYGGGSLGAGFALDVKGSTDVGLVVVPQKVVRVDTQTGDSIEYFNLDWNFVAIPHVYFGLGVGGGVSSSVGVGLIWGNLNRATDFGGWVGTGSANMRLLAGADMSVAAIRDTKNGRTYALGTIEFDWGAEASASIDAEGGRIFPLGSNGNVQVPKADKAKEAEKPGKPDPEDNQVR